MSSRIVMPIGRSYTPGLLMAPLSENIIVPGHFSVPTCVNQAAPFWMIRGMLHKVSTLLTNVGFP